MDEFEEEFMELLIDLENLSECCGAKVDLVNPGADAFYELSFKDKLRTFFRLFNLRKDMLNTFPGFHVLIATEQNELRSMLVVSSDAVLAQRRAEFQCGMRGIEIKQILTGDNVRWK